jgi:hypothetical protein
MAEKKKVLRDEQLRADLPGKLLARQLGVTSDDKVIGYKTSGGSMVWYTPEGGDASFDSLKITGLSASGFLYINSDGEVQVSTGGNVSGTTGTGNWKYDDSLLGTPAAGYWSVNNANPSLATELSINELDQNNGNFNQILTLLYGGSQIIFQDINDSDKFYVYNLVSTPSYAGGVFTVDVTVNRSGSTSVVDEDECSAFIEIGSSIVDTVIDGTWQFDTRTDGLISSGYLSLDDADPLNATKLYISSTDSDGENKANILSLLYSASTVVFQDKVDATKFAIVKIGSLGTDNSGIYEFDCNVDRAGSTSLALDDSCLVIFEISGASSSSPLDFIDFNPQDPNPTYTEGRLFYDDSKKAVSYYNEESDVTVNLGKELVIRVYNGTGSTITNGKVVTGNGTVTSGCVGVTLADASKTELSRNIGVATHDIENGTFGYVTRFGEVGGLNLSSFSNGDALYLTHDGNGDLTTTRPDDGCYAVIVGVVVDNSATEGILEVDPKIPELTVEVTDTNGFPLDQKDKTTLNYDEATRRFWITSSDDEFHFYELGEKYEVDTSTDVTGVNQQFWTDVEGEHWFQYVNGVLTHLANPTFQQKLDIIVKNAFVAVIQWDATNKTVIIDIQDERHGISMSPETHAYLHITRGAQYVSGYQLGDFDIDGDGDDDTSAQFSVSEGVYYDEDITHVESGIASTIGMPIIYNLGVNQNIRQIDQAGFAIAGQTGVGVYYNQNDGGDWKLTTVPDRDACCYHIFGFNGQTINTVSIMGQVAYTNVNQARDGASTEISNIISSLPFPEMIPVATIVIESREDYNNAVAGRIRSIDGENYISWTTTELAQGTAPSSHANLTNVQAAGLGVSQGHINTDAQDIYGEKTFIDNLNVPSIQVNNPSTVEGLVEINVGDITPDGTLVVSGTDGGLYDGTYTFIGGTSGDMTNIYQRGTDNVFLGQVTALWVITTDSAPADWSNSEYYLNSVSPIGTYQPTAGSGNSLNPTVVAGTSTISNGIAINTNGDIIVGGSIKTSDISIDERGFFFYDNDSLYFDSNTLTSITPYSFRSNAVDKLLINEDGSISAPDCTVGDITANTDLTTKEYVDTQVGGVSQGTNTLNASNGSGGFNDTSIGYSSVFGDKVLSLGTAQIAWQASGGIVLGDSGNTVTAGNGAVNVNTLNGAINLTTNGASPSNSITLSTLGDGANIALNSEEAIYLTADTSNIALTTNAGNLVGSVAGNVDVDTTGTIDLTTSGIAQHITLETTGNGSNVNLDAKWNVNITANGNGTEAGFIDLFGGRVTAPNQLAYLNGGTSGDDAVVVKRYVTDVVSGIGLPEVLSNENTSDGTITLNRGSTGSAYFRVENTLSPTIDTALQMQAFDTTGDPGDTSGPEIRATYNGVAKHRLTFIEHSTYGTLFDFNGNVAGDDPEADDHFVNKGYADSNYLGSINALTNKSNTNRNDILVIEDSEASYAKKKATISEVVGAKNKSIYIEKMTSSDSIPIMETIEGYRVSAVRAVVTNGTSFNFSLKAGNAFGTSTITVVNNQQCDSTSGETISINTADVTEGYWLWIDIESVVGTDVAGTVSIEYTKEV